MVPGTAERVVDQQTVGQWTTVMRANSADREQLVRAPHEQYRLAVGMPLQHCTVGNF